MKNKKSIIIGIMCAALIVMGVGYAVLNKNLDVSSTATYNGEFKVVMTNVSASTTTYPNMGTGTYSGNLPATEVDLNATLYKPLDYVEYVVTVQNQGTMKAKYKGILNNENSNIINVTSTDLKDTNEDEVTILDPNETATFTVRIEMDRDVTTLPEKGTSYSFTLNPQFEQVTNTQEIAPIGNTRYYSGTNAGKPVRMGLDENNHVVEFLFDNENYLGILGDNPEFVAYNSNTNYSEYIGYSDFSPAIGSGDYTLTGDFGGNEGIYIIGVLRDDKILFMDEPGSEPSVLALETE